MHQQLYLAKISIDMIKFIIEYTSIISNSNNHQVHQNTPTRIHVKFKTNTTLLEHTMCLDNSNTRGTNFLWSLRPSPLMQQKHHNYPHNEYRSIQQQQLEMKDNNNNVCELGLDNNKHDSCNFTSPHQHIPIHAFTNITTPIAYKRFHHQHICTQHI